MGGCHFISRALGAIRIPRRARWQPGGDRGVLNGCIGGVGLPQRAPQSFARHPHAKGVAHHSGGGHASRGAAPLQSLREAGGAGQRAQAARGCIATRCRRCADGWGCAPGLLNRPCAPDIECGRGASAVAARAMIMASYPPNGCGQRENPLVPPVRCSTQKLGALQSLSPANGGAVWGEKPRRQG